MPDWYLIEIRGRGTREEILSSITYQLDNMDRNKWGEKVQFEDQNTLVKLEKYDK